MLLVTDFVKKLYEYVLARSILADNFFVTGVVCFGPATKKRAKSTVMGACHLAQREELRSFKEEEQ